MPRKRSSTANTSAHQKQPGRPKTRYPYPPEAQPTWSQAVGWVDLTDAERAAMGQKPEDVEWRPVSDTERDAIDHGLKEVLAR
jgi:hypothetical protein